MTLMSNSTLNARYLLFDDAWTDSKRGVTATLEPPFSREGPVLSPDQPWESRISGDSNISVIEHDGQYKLWYGVPFGRPDPKTVARLKKEIAGPEFKNLDEKMRDDYVTRSNRMLCYAVSDDGVNWTKPDLGLVEHNGSKKNNIVMIARLGATVFLDPQAPSSERFKMILGDGPRRPHVNLEDPTTPPLPCYQAVYGAVSPDGIRWKRSSKPIMPWYTDTTNAAYWDDETRKYVAFVRYNEGMVFRNGKTVSQKHGRIEYRAIGWSESSSFKNFPPPVKIHEPDPHERHPYKTGMDYYNSSALKYPFAPGVYLLFVSDFDHRTEMLDVHLALSRDGKRYHHWKEPWLGLGLEGAFDSQSIYMGSGMIRKGQEIWMYYAGYPHRHATRYHAGRGASGIGRVRLRPDGFISQRFARSGGRLATLPIQVDGDTLRVNFDAGAGGVLKLELRNHKDKPIAGHTASECDPLHGNDPGKVITWKGKASLAALRGQSVKLHFTGRSAKLFSFCFEPAD